LEAHTQMTQGLLTKGTKAESVDLGNPQIITNTIWPRNTLKHRRENSEQLEVKHVSLAEDTPADLSQYGAFKREEQADNIVKIENKA
jgi:hypothetical protein